jgi:hypothetical protein
METIDCEYIDYYRDGGTKIVEDIKTGTRYFIDKRIGSKTRGKVFDRYPSHEGAKQVDIKINIVLCRIHHRKYSKYSPIVP